MRTGLSGWDAQDSSRTQIFQVPEPSHAKRKRGSVLSICSSLTTHLITSHLFLAWHHEWFAVLAREQRIGSWLTNKTFLLCIQA